MVDWTDMGGHNKDQNIVDQLATSMNATHMIMMMMVMAVMMMVMIMVVVVVVVIMKMILHSK